MKSLILTTFLLVSFGINTQSFQYNRNAQNSVSKVMNGEFNEELRPFYHDVASGEPMGS